MFGWHGRELLGRAEPGSAGYVRLGTGCNVGQCTARRGRLGEVRRGLAGSGPVRFSGAWQAWLGWGWRGSALSGPAGMVWYVVARKGAIRQVWQGYARKSATEP